MVKFRFGDLAAVVALALLCLGVYSSHISGRTTTIGTIDRLATFTSVRKFHVETLKEGELQGWNERTLAGVSTWGLPHMAPLPLAWVAAMFPYRDLYTAFGWISCGLLILAAWFAYWFIKEVVGRGPPAIVGAALYALSPTSIFLNLSVDDAYLIFVITPLVMLVIRRIHDQNFSLSYVGLSTLLGILFFISFIQGIAYVLILFSGYAMWRGFQLKRWGVPMIFAASVLTALLIAAPRLGTVAEDLSLLHRSSAFITINPLEILRLFHDGIFGNTMSEINRINHFYNPYEGIRLYTSGFAVFLIITMLIRSSDGTWFPLVPSRRDDMPFFFLFFVTVAAMLSVIPLQEILYRLFLKRSLLHGRFSIAGLLPLCVLVAALLDELVKGAWESLSPIRRRIGLCVTLIGGGVIAWSVPHASASVAMMLNLPDAFRWGSAQHGFWPFASIPLMAVMIECAIFAGLMTLSMAGISSNFRRATTIGLLGATMAFSAFITAYDRVNGPQTKTDVPFQDIEFFSAGPDDFKLPSADSIVAMHRRLEVQDYRSVVIAAPDRFPGSITPHIAQFWELRLLEGYINGLPLRWLELPWPKGVQGVRTIHFTSDDQLYWPLLSALNVKYVIRLNDALYFNRGRVDSDVTPDEIDVKESPLPVTPRVFWAGSVHPVNNAVEAGKWFEQFALIGNPAENLAKRSVAEGYKQEKIYSVKGAIRADFRGDRISIHFDPSSQPRFLVLNEMFHPRWSAYADGQELRIYPVNVVMRGIEIPPNISGINLRFIPFIETPTAWRLFGGGVAILLCLFVFLWRSANATASASEVA